MKLQFAPFWVKRSRIFKIFVVVWTTSALADCSLLAVIDFSIGFSGISIRGMTTSTRCFIRCTMTNWLHTHKHNVKPTWISARGYLQFKSLFNILGRSGLSLICFKAFLCQMSDAVIDYSDKVSPMTKAFTSCFSINFKINVLPYKESRSSAYCI